MPTPTLLTTPAQVEPWLATDRRWCAYAIADLEEPFWPHCRFWAQPEPAPAILLHLTLPSWDLFWSHGDPATTGAIVANLPQLPEQVNLMLPTATLPIFERWYHFGPIDTMLRQCLTPDRFRPIPSPGVERLHDPAELTAFYAGRAPGYDPAQVVRGAYFGARGADGRLLAVAGTHAASARYRIGVVGNVFTEPAARGQGLAPRLVSAVVATLFTEFACTDVVLNVRVDNASAIQLYQRLGFWTECQFVETVASCA
jgi:RimJ/RimL family protein N-acetyltransferase